MPVSSPVKHLRSVAATRSVSDVTSSVTLDLTGRRALVTGAGQGVGAAIATLLADAGATVAVNDLVAERAEMQAAALRERGAHAVAAPFDVTDFAQVTAAVEGLGGIDILVNNAGNAGGDTWPGMVPFAQTSPADWQPFLAVNLFGVMHCVRAVLPSMIATGWGRVVTIISDAARVGESNMAAYATAKGGAAALTRSVAKEVARHGVTANNISLGTMRTPLTEASWAAASAEEIAARLRAYPIRRPGQPDDVAGLVGYLVGASWITGQTIPLNGGYSVAL
jgi:NAD(P)-dependent dehydrogenase (short-subunit alcohol dehydrogenase family)